MNKELEIFINYICNHKPKFKNDYNTAKSSEPLYYCIGTPCPQCVNNVICTEIGTVPRIKLNDIKFLKENHPEYFI